MARSGRLANPRSATAAGLLSLSFVEIDAIRADLLNAVNRAVQPTHASIRIKL